MRAPGDDEVRSTPELELELPSRPEFVRVARQAVGALARLHQVPDDIVDDIKLAVSEACTQSVATSTNGDGRPLALRAWAEPDRIAIELADPAPSLRGDQDEGDRPFDQTLALPVIQGLVDEVAVTPREDRGATLRMVIAIPESPR
jgi:serine/threonine-protein kinase RsbW